jgi:RNA polymerase sigma-70 factor (ECF subfamily)
MQIAERRADRRTQSSPLSDEELVAKIVGGESALFEVLMRRNNQRIYRAVRAIVRDEAEVEDVMQQAYVSAYQHLSQFAGQARFSTWLTKIAVHEALGRKRRAVRLVSLTSSDKSADAAAAAVTPLAAVATPEDRSAARELLGVLEAALDELPETYRSVFVLREVEGLDTSEAASILDVSEDVVKTRLSRAKASLRAQIEQRVGMATSDLWQFGNVRCDRIVHGTLQRLAAAHTR